MKLVRVGAACLNQTPLDWTGNKARIVSAVRQARKQGISILCLPECCVSGYGCEDAFLSPGIQQTAWRILLELLPECRGIIVSLGLPVFFRNALFNTACLVVDGEIKGFVAKRYLASDGIHYEPRWFKPWPEGVRGELETAEGPLPIGDIYFDCDGIRIGFEICEDAWAFDRPGSELARRGVDIILNPSASHFAFGKSITRRRFIEEGSRAFGVTYIHSSLTGNEAGRSVYDGGAMIAASGRLVAAGPRFSYKDVVITRAVVDVTLSRMNRTRPVSFNPVWNPRQGDCVRADFSFPDIAPEDRSLAGDEWENSRFIKEEEFTRAIGLALFDYLRKSRSRGFVVSLSGGADSSAVSCLAAMMIRSAWKELGRDGFVRKLSHIPRLSDVKSPEEAIQTLLTCVYQSTTNSSDTTKKAARALTRAIGARYFEWNVDDLVGTYTKMISAALGRTLSWERDDLALQNIQARVRGPGVWFLANIQGALLLATSNRSEAAVGYATMDGDTCGGLSPIAGIDKAFLRKWLQWLEKRGPLGLGPIPELSLVNEQQPSAELRPKSSRQTDEDDLMPYDLLDAVERAAIRDKLMPDEICKLMTHRFPGYDKLQIRKWIRLFFRLWSKNQWKRERYAPSFHLDDENLDPKTWCRFPILSGGFEYELARFNSDPDGPGNKR